MKIKNKLDIAELEAIKEYFNLIQQHCFRFRCVKEYTPIIFSFTTEKVLLFFSILPNHENTNWYITKKCVCFINNKIINLSNDKETLQRLTF